MPKMADDSELTSIPGSPHIFRSCNLKAQQFQLIWIKFGLKSSFATNLNYNYWISKREY